MAGIYPLARVSINSEKQREALIKLERARASRAKVILEPHIKPNPKHREMWLRDPDGYVVVIASPDGEVGS
jgi:hypothetical protein